MQNFIEIGQTIAEIYQFILFFKMEAVCHFGFVGYLVVFITGWNRFNRFDRIGWCLLQQYKHGLATL